MTLQPQRPKAKKQNGHNGHLRQSKLLYEEVDLREAPSPSEDLTPNIHREDNLTLDELEEIWARRAYTLAEEPTAEATGEALDLLVFWLDGERYGIDVSNVREIYPLEQMTTVPRTPLFVAGVFSARGRISSVIDLRAFLGLPVADFHGRAKIMIVSNTDPTSETAQMEVGILADEVADVITIFKEEIQPPLTTHTGARAEYIQGVTADLLVVLNLNALLSDRQLIIHEELL